MMVFKPGKFINKTHQSQSALNGIRQAMLEVLGESSAIATLAVLIRVMNAADLQELWYLRGDVMSALAAFDGEAAAMRKLLQISDMFNGFLPPGFTTRPSPLAG